MSGLSLTHWQDLCADGAYDHTFWDGDQGKCKQVQQELKRSLKQAKLDLKKKVERKQAAP